MSTFFQTMSTQKGFAPGEYRQHLVDLLGHAISLAPEYCPLSAALGRVTSAQLTAPYPSPAFDNSQMDGYALTPAAATRSQRVFTVGHDIPAGFSGKVAVSDDYAYPIMTGAPLPAGYGAVVPVERSRVVTGEADAHGFAPEGGQVELPEIAPGSFVRTVGSDLEADAVLVEAGTRLTPVHLGVLAAQGYSKVPVRPTAKVLIYTGGEEVSAGADRSCETEKGSQPPAGKIYDANAPLLTGLLATDGVSRVYTRSISDDPEQLLEALRRDILELSPDLILTCGGISAGKYEVVRQTLTRCADPANTDGSAVYGMSADCWFGHVNQQPGGPQGLGLLTHAETGTVPIICLPGNPVSTLVSYTVLLRPALAAAGLLPGARVLEHLAQLETEEEVSAPAGKTQFRRSITRLTAQGMSLQIQVTPHGGVSSHLLHAASASNCLIELAPGATYSTGDTVKIHPLPGAGIT